LPLKILFIQNYRLLILKKRKPAIKPAISKPAPMNEVVFIEKSAIAFPVMFGEKNIFTRRSNSY
jgi:hypothetical protein